MEFNIKINNNNVKVTKGETILSVLKRIGIAIPTLCNMPELTPTGACRLCVVELENNHTLVTACSSPVSEGMKILTHSQKVISARKTIAELLLTNHPENCLYCDKSGNCELQQLAENLNIRERTFVGEKNMSKSDRSSPGIVRDMSKCILCGRCVRICEEMLQISAIDLVNRGKNSNIETVFQRGLFYSNCIHCGFCITACPTGAILEKTNIPQIVEKLNYSDKSINIIISGSTIASLATYFNVKRYEDARNYLVAALHDVGFKNVMTLSLGNDIFVHEISSIILERLNNHNEPLIISDCPSVKKYIKTELPEFQKYLPKVPTPQQILGKILKFDNDPQNDILVSVASCVAHKYEAIQSNNTQKGVPDIDYVITTKELLKLLKTHGIILPYSKKETPDKPSNSDSSGGVLLETKGGISEAIIRELYLKSGINNNTKKIPELKSDKQFIEYEFALGNKKYTIASINNVDTLRCKQHEILNNKYLFVEVRACNFGCIYGCGHIQCNDVENYKKLKKNILEFDEKTNSDTAGKNPFIKGYYKEKGIERLF
ncbi:MAG: (2Fe-2S)-binding protein [Bacteroidales bacterium]|jgi:iron only hydrogenase large subunit-like protein|nr:(2Fe-2S)-binding protein [Bacteroidales bacterium]